MQWASVVADLYKVDAAMDPNKKHSLIAGLYSAEAVYRDPLVEAQGSPSILSNFTSLSSIAKSGGLEIVHAAFSPETGTSGGTLRFEAVATYKLRYLPVMNTVTWQQWTTIVFDGETGLATSHTDHWSLESLLSALPVVGRVYRNVLRPTAGKLVHKLLGNSVSRLALATPRTIGLLEAASPAPSKPVLAKRITPAQSPRTPNGPPGPSPGPPGPSPPDGWNISRVAEEVLSPLASSAGALVTSS